MKKILIALILMLQQVPFFSQEVTGDWNGILKVPGASLRIVFHVTKTDSGYTSTMDSPDQKAFGIPLASTTFSGSSLNIQHPPMGLKYSGQLEDGNKITGTFSQGGQAFAMNLGKEKIEKEKIVRPQEPAQPYPYYTEEVKFKNEKDKITLAGTLSLPKKEGNFPAVILISGSGPQNRNEELLGHKPFLILADHLTKKGFAVLRYDDRGTAQSEGNFKTATTADFANDAEAAVKYLQNRKEISKNKIGLAGHSEGGIIAPMVAARSKNVAFIVLLAGTGVTGSELLLLQQEQIGRASGMSEDNLKKTREMNKGAFDIVARAEDAESLKTQLSAYLKDLIKNTPDSEKPKNINEEQIVSQQMEQLTNPWMSYFIKHDPSVILKEVKCPVLCLNGEKDLQVSPKVNLPAIQKALASGGNKNVTIKELPGLNHLFQECGSGSPDEYAKIEQTFSPMALSEISGWLLSVIK